MEDNEGRLNRAESGDVLLLRALPIAIITTQPRKSAIYWINVTHKTELAGGAIR
eukprot:gene13894-15342_t